MRYANNSTRTSMLKYVTYSWLSTEFEHTEDTAGLQTDFDEANKTRSTVKDSFFLLFFIRKNYYKVLLR